MTRGREKREKLRCAHQEMGSAAVVHLSDRPETHVARLQPLRQIQRQADRIEWLTAAERSAE